MDSYGGGAGARRSGGVGAETSCRACDRIDYQLEYGTATLELPVGSVKPGERVAVVDDVLATGGTVAASVELIRRAGADVTGIAVVLELAALGGRSRLDALPVHALRTI